MPTFGHFMTCHTRKYLPDLFLQQLIFLNAIIAHDRCSLLSHYSNPSRVWICSLLRDIALDIGDLRCRDHLAHNIAPGKMRYTCLFRRFSILSRWLMPRQSVSRTGRIFTTRWCPGRSNYILRQSNTCITIALTYVKYLLVDVVFSSATFRAACV